MVHKASAVNLANEDEEFLKTVEALTKKQFSQTGVQLALRQKPRNKSLPATSEDHGWLSQPIGEDRLLQCAEAQRLIDALKGESKLNSEATMFS